MAKNRRTLKKSRTARKRQNGGVIFACAPVNSSVPPNQRQPTDAIMERATTAGGGGGDGEDTNSSEVTIVNNRVVNNSTIQANPSQVNVANLTKSPPVSYLKNTTLRKQYDEKNKYFKKIIYDELYESIEGIVRVKTNEYIKLRININWSEGPGLIINECLENKIPVDTAKDILLIYINSYKKWSENSKIVGGYSEEKALNYANGYAIQEATKAINNYKNENPLNQGLLKYNQSTKQTPSSTSFISRLFGSTGGKYKRTHRNKRKATRLQRWGGDPNKVHYPLYGKFEDLGSQIKALEELSSAKDELLQEQGEELQKCKTNTTRSGGRKKKYIKRNRTKRNKRN